MKVLTIGYCTTDLVLRTGRFAGDDEEVSVDQITEYPGGSAANVAVGLRRLGIESAFLGCLARDERGSRNRKLLRDEGVDIGRVVDGSGILVSPFVVAVVVPDGSRRLYFHAGSGGELDPDGIPDSAFDGIDWVHVCTLEPRFLERVLRIRSKLRRALRVSADPGCVGLEGDRAATVRRLMPELDVLFVNEVEFARLFPASRPEDLASRAAGTLPPHVIVKHGPKGAFLFEAGSGGFQQPAYTAATVDTTGAGDAFAAGYLGALLKGFSPRRRAAFAAAVAALSTTRFGCQDALPTLEQAERFLARRESA